MSASHIIDARHQLRWYQRLLSDVSTALLWSGWLWLWAPLVSAYGSLLHLGGRLTPLLAKLAPLGSEGLLGQSVMALVGTSGTLIVWNRLPGPRADAAPALAVRDYARHFELPEHELREARKSAVCVVHHDAEGRIVRLESRAASHRAAAA
jgi:poly-beta-1,6-N-acetyl-D-glucosamine biosynthesis protein PgaD